MLLKNHPIPYDSRKVTIISDDSGGFGTTPDRKFMMNSKVYYSRLYTAGGRIVPAFASQRCTTKTRLAIVYKPCKDFTIADRFTYFAVGYKSERYLPVMCRILREIASLKK